MDLPCFPHLPRVRRREVSSSFVFTVLAFMTLLLSVGSFRSPSW
jgi:hypothetical protein